MQVIAVVVAAIMIPSRSWCRRPPALGTRRGHQSGDAGPQPEMSIAQAVRSAAIHHSSATKFLLLRHAFRPDHPHRELRHQLRHPADRRGVDLQPGGASPD